MFGVVDCGNKVNTETLTTARTRCEDEAAFYYLALPEPFDFTSANSFDLVLGAGGDSDVADRRMAVYDLLARRRDAVSFRLEDFGLTPDELALWAAAYENLCAKATHIVLVIEDYEGSYVWELGYLFHEDIREKVWVLKREYESATANRAHYDNGVAASHLQLLENADRTVQWTDRDELETQTGKIP